MIINFIDLQRIESSWQVKQQLGTRIWHGESKRQTGLDWNENWNFPKMFEIRKTGLSQYGTVPLLTAY